MTRILDRYSSAVQSSNLKPDPLSIMSDLDVLAAAGLASQKHQLGIDLTRLFSGGRVEPVVETLADLVMGRAHYLAIKMPRVKAVDIGKAVLAWYRYGTCQPCGGTGFQRVTGTPMLSEINCTHCAGSGKLPFEQQFQHEVRPLAVWLRAEIDFAQQRAGQAAMKKLAPRLEL